MTVGRSGAGVEDREIGVTARLQHPHIVEGGSLRTLLKTESQLGVAEAIGIAREIADALGYTHALGIVHRVLADFGIAAIADYQYVAARWRHADPELQRYVGKARDGIGRLTAEQ